MLKAKIANFLYSPSSKSGWRNTLIRCAWKFVGLIIYNPLVLNILSKRITNNVLLEESQITETTYPIIKNQLIKCGLNIVDVKLDVDKYKKYIIDAKYSDHLDYFDGGSHPLFFKKALEHFFAYEFLQLNQDDIYIDIANARSPVPEIYSRLSGCKSYRQDLCFPLGINDNTIGGDAANMPIPDGFATKMALHCSFEHFELDSDIRFIKEAQRVLRKGGKLCIIPLYMQTSYIIRTDPLTWLLSPVTFDEDTEVHFRRYKGNRHERFYNMDKLQSRVINNAFGFKTTIYYLVNEKEIHPKCTVKFAAIFEKIY